MSLLAGIRERRARGALSLDLRAARARVTALEGVATTMLGCVRSLVLDIDELGAPELKTQLAELAIQLRSDSDATELTRTCAQQRADIVGFAEREREYLERRDAELHRIILVLSDGLAGVSNGASAYHKRLLDNGSRFEAASRLSDLVKMRAAITARSTRCAPRSPSARPRSRPRPRRCAARSSSCARTWCAPRTKRGPIR